MINVDTVYKTVLLILNKEQRGILTPDEFNKTATKVQLDIFEQYFDELNQQLRIPQSEFDYSDRQLDIDDKISRFKCLGNCAYSTSKFELPETDTLSGGTNVVYEDIYSDTEFAFYRLGAITYVSGAREIEVQRLQRNEFYNIDRSDLTAPSENFPVYLYESNKLIVKPASITGGLKASFLRKPRDVKWTFTIGSRGEYVYGGSPVHFELHTSEQSNVINRILLYSGVIIKDPQVVQLAAQQIQQDEANKNR
jgi:hypothetical protein